ncbi:MAG: beta-N-acetylhexosaminidase [Actinomycetota bacterium]|nr:beta-N-acetylhexosaminidase [Actinomycetota bacterium]
MNRFESPTLDALAHRVVMGSFAGPTLPPWAARLLEGGLGSVCLFGSNIPAYAGVRALSDAVHDAGADVLVTTDEEGGDVTRLHTTEGSPFPGNAALGAVDDPALTRRVAASIGSLLAAAGVDLDLAPVVDVNSNPRNPVIGVRSFGADAELVARHTTAYVDGLQSVGVGACAKHFPGHGDTAVDSHLGLPTVDVGLDVLLARELVPFAAAVRAGTLAVMTSHVLLPALDADRPATLSPTVLGLLRDELGFDGLLVSDAVDMAGASAGRGVPAAAVLALAAGCDLVCLGADKDEADHLSVLDAIVEAVREGSLPEARLAEAAGRVVEVSRTVRGWHRPDGPAGDTPGIEAARRALSVDRALPDLTGAVVLRVRTGSNVAVGDVPWGLPVDGAVLAGGAMVDVRETSTTGDVLQQVGTAPVVALVRGPHRYPWALNLLHSLAEGRPNLVVVEMGWPGEADLPGAAVVRTYGASATSGVALDELLAGARGGSKI